MVLQSTCQTFSNWGSTHPKKPKGPAAITLQGPASIRGAASLTGASLALTALCAAPLGSPDRGLSPLAPCQAWLGPGPKVAASGWPIPSILHCTSGLCNVHDKDRQLSGHFAVYGCVVPMPLTPALSHNCGMWESIAPLLARDQMPRDSCQ
jgi:hypothetical protein